MGRKYAKGKHAVAECQRSGQKMLYRDLVEDGHIPGLLVHPDWWEPKHPQEIPPRVDDPIALERPAPEISVPTGSGDPESPGDACATSPDTDNYLPSTTLAGVTAGEFFIAVETAVKHDAGECVFVQRDDDTWFVSKAAVGSQFPTYSIQVSTAYSGGAASAGNSVYVGEQGNGVPVPPPPPAVSSFVIGLTFRVGGGDPRQYLSDDDISTWSAANVVHAFVDALPDFRGLAFGGGAEGDTWVAVGSDSFPAAFYSQNDGIDWTPISVPNNTFGETVEEAAYSSSLDQYVFVGSEGYIWRNTTGVIGWSSVQPVTTPLRDVCWAGTYWFATGDDRVLLTSSDSQSWSQVSGDPPNTFATTDFYACWANGGRLFAGDELGQVHYSDDDGASWTTGTGENLGSNVESIAGDGSGTVVAVGPLQAENIYSTDNGATWARGNTLGPNFSYMKGVIYEEGYGFVAIGAEDNGYGVISTSADGITWTSRVVDTGNAAGEAWAIAGKNEV